MTAKTPLSYEYFEMMNVRYKFGTDYELILNDLIDKNKDNNIVSQSVR